jgi:DNA polymerase-1
LSEDENLLNAFRDGEDIHHKTAEFIFPWKVITGNERRIAKAVNFWVIYWISSFGLSKMIGISMKEWKEYIDKFFVSYPKVREFLDNIIKECEKTGYVETIFWRRRYINGINDGNKMIKQGAEREAINMPIQWTSADIIKLAMIGINDFLKKENLKSKMIMQVHDELVFDVYPWEEDIVSSNTKHIMESVLVGKPIILLADVGIGDSWREAK